MQFGILDLVDWHPGTMTQEERYQQVIELAVVAEELGFDTYWVGEHHFSHYISRSIAAAIRGSDIMAAWSCPPPPTVGIE